MKSIYFLGECMVELKSIDDTTMRQSFAGDVYNSAVYLKRCFPSLNSGILTAVGDDALSKRMVEQFEQEQINVDFAFVHSTKAPGVYYIQTDENGERSFTYWRNDSAARQIMTFLDDDVIDKLAEADMVFVSGISLAILDNTELNKLWGVLETLRGNGVNIVFDPNYRARLWHSQQEAKSAFDRAFALANTTLPGVEDLAVLYGLERADKVIQFCREAGCQEIVVKDGPSSVVTSVNGQMEVHPVKPVDHVVDTTSAGDAFNGAYLGARLSGFDVKKAVACAAKAAGTVIQYPGAIAPAEAFNHAMVDFVSA